MSNKVMNFYLKVIVEVNKNFFKVSSLRVLTRDDLRRGNFCLRVINEGTSRCSFAHRILWTDKTSFGRMVQKNHGRSFQN